MNLNSTLSMQNIIFLFVLFIISSVFALGQPENELFKIPIKDSSDKTINSYYFKLIKKGYLTPELRIKKENKFLYLEVIKGKNFKHFIIETKSLNNEKHTPSEIGYILENKYKSLINNGFPFANLKLDSIHFEENTIKTILNIQKGPFFQWGDIFIKGNAKINEQILRSLLDIKKDDPFNEEVFLNIENKINQLPFISLVQKSELLFENGKVNLFLYINSKQINNVSGTIGLQQNTISQKYFLIGDLKMKLINQLKRSESFDLQWRRIQESTQSLKIAMNYPSIFKSNFGIDNQFNIYKKDSTFIELKNQLGIQYLTQKGFLIKANYKFIESSILNINNINTDLGKSTTYLYGLSLNKQYLDYIPAPKKGFNFNIDICLGKRTTLRNDSINQKFDNTFRAEYQTSFYLSLYRRNILKVYFSGDIYLAPFFYQNELIRFGGLINQRGFREDEFRGNMRFTQSLEYRYMIEQNSYLFAFFDCTLYKNILIPNFSDTPFGFGSGLSFGTEQGIFSISYAIGKQLNNPILLKNGIIHFGYISYF